VGAFIDDEHPVLSCVLWVSLLATIAFIFRELLVFGPALATAIGHAISTTAVNVIRAFGLLGAEVGAAAAGSLVAAAGVPIGVVVVYKFLVKTEERRKAWIVAIGLFLNPVFVDFFRDELPERWLGKEDGGVPGARIAISIVFATVFMIASALYDKSSWLSRWVAGALYLTPAFIMIGYLVRFEHPAGVVPFLSHLGLVESMGLVGLVVTALFGIYLSRTHSAEA
jgi:hypothetical protein